MARRFQEITEVYRQEIAALARADRWTAFQRSACLNYKLPCEERCWYTHSVRTERLCWR